MKKLGKLKLSGFHTMNESEMKSVTGGYVNIGSSCNTDCSGPSRCWVGSTLGTCKAYFVNGKYLCGCEA